MLVEVLALFALTVAVIVFYFKSAFSYWHKKGVVTLKPSIPFGNGGSSFLQRKTLGEVFKEAYDKFKPEGHRYCGFYMITKPSLIIFDLDLVKTILTNDFANFTDHSNYINEEIDPMTGHLFFLKGLKWRNLRAKLTPTFTSGKMKMMFQILLGCSRELVEVMDEYAEKQEAVEIKEILARFTTDVISSCAFGLESNSLKNPDAEFRRYGKKMFEFRAQEAFRNLLAFTFPQILDYFRIPLTRSDVAEFFSEVVRKTVDYRETNNIIRKDFMHLLIQLKNNVQIYDEDSAGQLRNESATNENVGKSLTMTELAAQAFGFFGASYETSSTTLNFCFYELVQNLHVQEKLREEIMEVLQKYDGQINYNALTEMSYMDNCIYETLRKYPPFSGLFRECTQSYVIPKSNLIIEKGTSVFIPALGIHHDPEYYPNPEQFDPERFAPENKTKRHHFAWLPFGEGPRACIGLRFAMMQIKLALTVLLSNYKFTLHPKTKLPLVMDSSTFILSVVGGVWLQVEKIQGA